MYPVCPWSRPILGVNGCNRSGGVQCKKLFASSLNCGRGGVRFGSRRLPSPVKILDGTKITPRSPEPTPPPRPMLAPDVDYIGDIFRHSRPSPWKSQGICSTTFVSDGCERPVSSFVGHCSPVTKLWRHSDRVRNSKKLCRLALAVQPVCLTVPTTSQQAPQRFLNLTIQQIQFFPK